MKAYVLWIAFFIFSFAPILNGQELKTDLVYKVREAKPDKDHKRPPVLIMLHGYGSNEDDLFEITKTIDEKYLIFSLRAPFNGSDIGYAWYDLKFLPNKQLSYNYEQAKESRAKILSFISNACKAYQADSTKVFILGYSQGTIMGYDLALTHPDKICGLVALSGKMLEESKKNCKDNKALKSQHYFIGHGYSDNIIDVKESETAEAFLKEKKIGDITYKKYEMPHAIMSDELIDFKSWLSRQLKPKIKSSGK